MIKFSDKFNLVPKNQQKSGTERIKSGIAVDFGPKIRTVPLKVGQLVSMVTTLCEGKFQLITAITEKTTTCHSYSLQSHSVILFKFIPAD